MKKALLITLIIAIVGAGLFLVKSKKAQEEVLVNPEEILNTLEETNPDDFGSEGLNDLEESSGPASDADEIDDELKSLEQDLNSVNADDFSSSGLSEF